KLENTYSTPSFICSLNNHESLIEELDNRGIEFDTSNRVFKFGSLDKENVKNLLTTVFSDRASQQSIKD
ncbi:hypothetical protein ACFLSX_05445, partial [Calditrichota bacterium]